MLLTLVVMPSAVARDHIGVPRKTLLRTSAFEFSAGGDLCQAILDPRDATTDVQRRRVL
jgi:hypothetical protein